LTLDAIRRVEGTGPWAQRASDLGKPSGYHGVNEQALEHLRWQASGPRAQRPSCSCGGVRACVAWRRAPVRWHRLRSESGPSGPYVAPARRRGGVPPLLGGLLRRRPAGGLRAAYISSEGAETARADLAGLDDLDRLAAWGALRVLSARDM